MVQKAFVEVNEEGSEAAAVTVRVASKGSARGPPCVVVDHPFMFVITDNRTGAVLFLGRAHRL